VPKEQPHTHPQQYEPDAVSASVSSLYPAGADIELHMPASATSFASTCTPMTAG
jgi:hypothetical protein